MPWVVLDFETLSTCDLEEAGAFRYAEDPTTEILCAAFSVDGRAGFIWRPEYEKRVTGRRLLELVEDPAVIFIAHNAQFEKAIWRNIMVGRYGWPDIPNERWHCTMAACAQRGLPLSLEMACAVLRLPYQKNMEGAKLVRQIQKFDKAGNYNMALLDGIIEYCMDDVKAEVALHERLGFLPPAERPVWLLNQEMNERGLQLDAALIEKAQQVVDGATPPLIEEFRRITGLVPTQVQKVHAWVNANGVKIPNLQGETVDRLLGAQDIDEDSIAEGDELGDVPDIPPAVRRALTIRRLIGSASVKKLRRMLVCMNEDGRARGACQYHGTQPGRSAGRLFQPYNFPRGTIQVDMGSKKAPPSPDTMVDALMTGDHEYVASVIGPPVETVVSSLRHAIVAAPGKVLVSGDYAGIQARVVLALAGQHDKTALMAAGADVYCDMAGQIYKRPITKADKVERQTGKNSVLGLGFQMGWKKFKLKYGYGLADDFCEMVVNTYRNEWAPLVPKLWRGLQDAATMTVHRKTPHMAYGIEYRLEDVWLTARLPSGRKLWYFDPRPVMRPMPWDEFDVRPAFTYRAMKMGHMQTIYPFGGSLTENVVMGIEVDIHRRGMQNLKDDGQDIVLEVYDEILAEVPAADVKRFEACMLDQPQWVRDMGIPIAVECWTGDRYRK